MMKEVDNIQDFSNAVFRFVIGRLFIVSSIIEDYEKLIYAYSSFIEFESSVIWNSEPEDQTLVLVSGTLLLWNTTISNIRS